MVRRHAWEDMRHRSGDQKCGACGMERTKVSNVRRRYGLRLGKHWEYWRKDKFGTRLSKKAGPCPGPKAVASHG
jgi:hypothetical protein